MTMITVDGIAITDDLLSLEAQLQDADDPAAAWEQAARALVVRELLLAEATRHGITGQDAEPGEEADEAAIRRLLETELKLPEPTETELERWYQHNLDRLKRPDRWQVQHLLIAANPGDERAIGAAREKAETMLAEVLDDPTALTVLAARFSDCPSRTQGGDLGLIERGSTVPEFETHLAGLAAGEVCPTVVQSRFGLHIIRVLACHKGRVPPLQAVRPRIIAFLQETSWRQAVQGYIASLAARASIKGFDLFAGESAPARPSAWPAGSSCTAAGASAGHAPNRDPVIIPARNCS
ncbi:MULTISPECIES: peptidylprolyl isomerase [Pseudomonas]|nr:MULTISPECIES: peptidylprolyl isomerase [Pseudomonas]RRW44961.1 peptidylprolyl isomerase [Pseudomonas luteola]